MRRPLERRLQEVEEGGGERWAEEGLLVGFRVRRRRRLQQRMQARKLHELEAPVEEVRVAIGVDQEKLEELMLQSCTRRIRSCCSTFELPEHINAHNIACPADVGGRQAISFRFVNGLPRVLWNVRQSCLTYMLG